MQEYYVVTEQNGLIKDEHIKIADKFHNNIQKVSSKEDTNYKIYWDWILNNIKEALKS